VTLSRTAFRRAGVRLSTLRGAGRAGGEFVVLLHGLAGAAAEMAPLATALHDDGHRVIALDQRGHGHSTRRPADLSRAAFTDDVLALLDEPAWLIGQSMGAHTAMLAAAARPGLVRGLVMIEGGVGGSTEDYPSRLGRWFAGWPTPFADESAALAFLGDTPVGRAWVADLEQRDGGLRPRFDPDVLETAIRGVAETARWAQWERITAPVLLVHGECGNQDAEELSRMRSRPGVRHVVVPGAGHDVHLDRPTETLSLIRRFIGG
jgi:pimeloyl-ACP methyl ester carboxylesterase